METGANAHSRANSKQFIINVSWLCRYGAQTLALIQLQYGYPMRKKRIYELLPRKWVIVDPGRRERRPNRLLKNVSERSFSSSRSLTDTTVRSQLDEKFQNFAQFLSRCRKSDCFSSLLNQLRDPNVSMTRPFEGNVTASGKCRLHASNATRRPRGYGASAFVVSAKDTEV